MNKYIFGCLTLTSLKIWCARIKEIKECKKFPCLIFHDNFKRLDFKTWQHIKTAADTGNNEFQYYTNNRSNSFVNNGVLYIKPTLTNMTYGNEFLNDGILDLFGSSKGTSCTSNRRNHGCYRKGSIINTINPIQSASLRTAKSFSFKYGRLEARVKLPQGDWIWPAVWLLPRDYVYGRWPASGEVDILESRGNQNLSFYDYDGVKTHVGNKMVAQSLHWGPNYRADSFFKTSVHTTKHSGSFAHRFHVYAMNWTKNAIILSIDGRITLNVTLDQGGFWKLGNFRSYLRGVRNPWESGSKLAPFDEEFYIVLNVAVGGTNNYFHPLFDPKPPWKNDDGSMNNTDLVGMRARGQFWGAREKWLGTWRGNDVAMKVDYIKVWKDEPP